ncbi:MULTISPECIES: monovalent cation/H+ antiporter complex subunit F [unclassified Fusibacter]|uniref:monovalent cation/H+ antiporter complex subunit F n=1 Tax=unclassified Fusibacter TaxID=2624464 RepID=UPI0010128222|nr:MULTISPECIES: monovalent cation/H+ antiporter complex subunit F [unclassified Fusibacter]MCK8061085.1 monovalent cation/H+ antiporter complex subunit F [Fusibacter sp. A2]NPE23379.1 cation:proton antiporter [Fusibacter sp. A1]RXV59424.1 cation:proton antiporter [Fusibacter sp. A1]
MDKFFVFSVVFLCFTILICMYRVVMGPTKGDRMIGINIIGTKTMVIIALTSFILKENYFIDVVLVYALINYIGSYVVTRGIATSKGEF